MYPKLRLETLLEMNKYYTCIQMYFVLLISEEKNWKLMNLNAMVINEL